MLEKNDRIWIRTQVRRETKQKARETAALLGWTIPGAECAALELMFCIFTPRELADHILDALRMSEPEIEGEEEKDTL